MGTKTKKWYTVWVGPDKFWDGKRVDFSDIATKWETLEVWLPPFLGQE